MGNSADTLLNVYRERFSHQENYRNNLWKILCQRFFSAFVSEHSCVLDLGAGWCEFINNIKASTKYAMDLNPDTGLRLGEESKFLHQDCSEEWQLQSQSLDIVFTSNFLEHLPSKEHVERTIAEANRCLKDDGLIICLGPNIKYVPGRYWDFWDHFIPITDLSLAELLTLKDFSIQLRIPRFLPHTVSTEKKPPLFLLKWYLRLPALWPLFGRQFLVVGRKKEGVLKR